MLDLVPYDFSLFGVVPVFVNAGAALLPAIIAIANNVVSQLLRPAALWRSCKARPGVAAVVLLGIGVVAGTIVWLATPAAADAPRKKPAGPSILGEQRIDWAVLAVEWQRQKQFAAPVPTAAGDCPNFRGHDAQHGRENGTVPFSTDAEKRATIFGSGPLRNGYAGGGSPLGLTLAWEFPAPGSPAAEELEGAMFLASPAVVNGAVYGGSCLLDMRRNYGTLFCLDAKTGNVRWTSAVYKDAKGKEGEFKGFFSSPAVTADGKFLVIGQGLHNDDHCELVCVNTLTGRVQWIVKTPLHIEGSPAIEGDLAVAGAGAIEVGDDHKAKGHPGLVVAVKISTGEKLWEYQVNDPESSPVIADGVVYIGSGFNGNAVVALRTESDAELKQKGFDRLLWRAPTPHPATGAVTLCDDLVIIGCGNGDYVFADPDPDGAVIALDRKTSKERWKVPMPDGVLGKIAVLDGRAIVPVRNGEVLALDLKAAEVPKILWRQRVNGEKAILAGVAFTGKCVYAVSQDGSFAVLDAADGKLLEKHYLNAKDKPGEMGLSVSSPAVVGGRVFVGSETGGLRCFAGKEVRP
jgi:outer membrane protein assembly factor BamB